MTVFYLEIIELLFIVGAFVALIIGALLFINPGLVARLSTSGNKWYSSRRKTKALDIIRDTDNFYFNNHKAVGTSMLIVSVLAFYLVYIRMPIADDFILVFDDTSNAIGIGILLESLKWIFLVSIVLGLPVWFLLAFYPEKLKVINASLNAWISTRLLMLPLEEMHDGFDRYAVKNHRIFGSIFIMGSIFILYMFLK